MNPVEQIDLPNRFEALLHVLMTVVLGLPSILIILALVSIFSKPLRKTLFEKQVWIMLTATAVWIPLLLLIPSVLLTVNGDREQDSVNLRYDKISEEVQKRYGTTFTGGQLYELQWPEEKPSEGFKVFGSFDDRKQIEGANFETRKVYLVWADGKLNLSQSTDGESFTELKSKD